jgi:hypothetical protein
MAEDISACEVADHQIWTLVSDKQPNGSFRLCHVSIYEKIIENPSSYLGCRVEMVSSSNFCSMHAPLK